MRGRVTKLDLVRGCALLSLKCSPIPTTLLQILSETTSRRGKVRNSGYVHVENDSRKVGNTGARVKTEGSREESEFRRDKQGQGALYAGGGEDGRRM